MIFKLNLTITNTIIGILILFYFLQLYFGYNNLYYNNIIDFKSYLSLFSFLFHENLWHLYVDCYFIFYIGNLLERFYDVKRYILVYFFIIFFSNIFIFILYFMLGANFSLTHITGYLGYGLIGYMIGNIVLYNSLVYKQYLTNIVLNLGFFILLSLLLGIEIFHINYILILVSGLLTSIFITNKEYK